MLNEESKNYDDFDKYGEPIVSPTKSEQRYIRRKHALISIDKNVIRIVVITTATIIVLGVFLWIWGAFFHVSSMYREFAIQTIEVADELIDGEINATEARLLMSDASRAVYREPRSRKELMILGQIDNAIFYMWGVDLASERYNPLLGIVVWETDEEMLQYEKEQLTHSRNQLARMVNIAQR